MSTATLEALPGVGNAEYDLPEHMRFKNSDISLDDAVAGLMEDIKNGMEFKYPNVDLLIQAVSDMEWDD